MKKLLSILFAAAATMAATNTSAQTADALQQAVDASRAKETAVNTETATATAAAASERTDLAEKVERAMSPTLSADNKAAAPVEATDDTPTASDITSGRVKIGEISSARFTENPQLTSSASGTARAGKTKSATTLSDYSAAEVDYSYTYGDTDFAGMVDIEIVDSTNAVIYGFWGQTDTIPLTYDLDEGTVSVTPALIYTHSTYGEVWACSVDLDKMQYSSTTPISGTIEADGSITLGSWGAFVVSGSYKGGYFDVLTKTELKAANATITDILYDGSSTTNTDSVVTYYARIDQTYENQIEIYNFGNRALALKARLSSDSTVYIPSQYVFSNLLYGKYYTYSADYASSNSKQDGTITGQGTSTQITLGNWGYYSILYSSYYSRRTLSTTITFEAGTVSYPAALTLDWSGEGTEASPYVITTVDQINALSEKVEQGESYKGKYITLGNSIDMSASTRVFTPIGTSSAMFNGTFDGAGYTISNLTISTGNEEYQGFIGKADSASVIKNVTLSSPAISSSAKYCGTVVGASAGYIYDVTVTGATLSFGNYSCGGVVGYFNGYVLDGAKFDGDITASGDCGGIAGEILGYSVVSNVEAHGSISMSSIVSSSYAAIGGIVGCTLPQSSGEPTITDGYTDMTITDTSGYGDVGGIAGQVLTGTFERVFNAGPLAADASYYYDSYYGTTLYGSAGGVAGILYGGNLTDVYNANVLVNSDYSYAVAGLVGYVMSPIVSRNASGDTTKITYASTVNRCLNLGQVVMSTANESMGTFGKYYSDTIFHYVYYDEQLLSTTMPDDIAWMSKTTAELTSGTALDGFDTSVWDFTAGLYPRLKAYKDIDAAYIGAAPLTLKDGDNVDKVKRTFKISTENNIYWKLYSSSAYVDESTGLTISGDSVTLKNVYSSETIVALSSSDASLLKPLYLSTINPAAFTGSGTEDDPYLISSKADFLSLDEGVTDYGQDFKGDFFKQTCDIDFQNSTDFQGVGRGGNTSILFNGTFDGAGYELQNLAIDEIVNDDDGVVSSSLSDIAIAPFGFIGEYGTVKNLSIASNCDFKAYNYAAGIAVGNYGTIYNCKNYAPITVALQYAAGIVSLNYAGGTVEQCYNAGTVTTNSTRAAGITSYNAGYLYYNQNDGDIIGDSINPSKSAGVQTYVAGIAAYTISGNEIIGNINTGNIYAGKTVGGIATALNTTVFKGNINYGPVEHAQTSDAARGTMLSTIPTTNSTVEDNYYDKQIGYYGAAASKAATGLNGVTTSTLTSGNALDGIDADRVDFTQGLYPVIAAFKDEPAAVAHRKMVVKFADADNSNDVVDPASLYKADDLTWKLSSGEYFEISGDSLSVKDVSGTSPVRDTLTATVDTYQKVIPLLAMPVVFDGKGTEDDPFQIKTTDDMALLAEVTNNEGFSYNGRYFKVMNDIDFDSVSYTPVGYGSGSFNGYFNGNGMKFKNLTCSLTTTSDTYFGLFGNIDADGELYNLTIESGTITGYRYVGAFVGNLYGKIYDCVNYATVTTSKYNYCGGFAAVVKDGGLVQNCTNYGDIAGVTGYNGGIAYTVESGGTVDACVNEADITSAKSYLAGIAVYSAGTIKNCVNRGVLTATGSMGGIVASSQTGDSILNCVNEGEIVGSGSYVGGIVGLTGGSGYTLYVHDCYNTAAVSGKGYLGGLGGRMYAGAVFEDCYNTGSVTSASSTYVGGVVGYLAYSDGYDSNIINCYNTGDVSAAGNYVGGVMGRNAAGCVTDNCYNTGTVYSTGNYVGGIAGSHPGTAYNCWNAGNVTAVGSAAGGFSGLAAGVVYGCFNLGDVTSTSGTNTSGTAGGLWGYGQPSIYYSYNMGTVTGPAYVGGLLGGTFSATVLGACYNAGTVASTTASAGGNISPTSKYTSSIALEGIYYDTDVNSDVYVSNVDEMSTGLSTRALTLTAINDSAFQTLPGMYPTLIAQADNQLANYFAAVPVVAEGDTYSKVTSTITIGTPEGTTWTASDNLSIVDGTVYTNSTGDAWLTKTYGDYSKTYTLYIDTATGITDTLADSEIATVEYFTVGGILVGDERPDTPGIYIERTTYTSGRTACQKVAVSGR